MIDSRRIHTENRKPIAAEGRFVLYWMSTSLRVRDNHALSHALSMANHLERPLLVLFVLDGRHSEAAGWQLRFMAEGFPELERDLDALGIGFRVRIGHPPEEVGELGRDACAIVTDHGYLRNQRRWRDVLAAASSVRMVSVESNVVVPVETALGKRAYAAHVLRPHMWRLMPEFLEPVPMESVRTPCTLSISGEGLADLDGLLRRAGISDLSAPRHLRFKGGEREGERMLGTFVKSGLSRYTEDRRYPHTASVSFLSPYLHFGMIAPRTILQTVRQSEAPQAEIDAYVEQLVVRRELAVNFVWYSTDYARYETLPGWAQETLDTHRKDPRDPLYDGETLLQAVTHDPYWNAAMREMQLTGFLHNHMRMYWGKKVLEWMETPEVAWEWLIATNNRLFLDGRDPNSYAGCGWIFGLHDSPWFERPIFGKIRYMAASGLERKCRITNYLERVAQLDRHPE